MRSKATMPGLGKVPDDIDPDLRKLLLDIREIVEIREGRRGSDYLDRAVTFRDLVDLGLITESQVPRK